MNLAVEFLRARAKFFDSNPVVIIFLSLIAFVINLVILFYISPSAIKAEEKIKLQKDQKEIHLVQTRLLGYMLKNQGMDKNVINKIIKGTYIAEPGTL